MVVLPLLNSLRAISEPDILGGRNGNRSMTKDAHHANGQGGVAAGVRVRAFAKPRPSLGSSRALLLLSRP